MTSKGKKPQSGGPSLVAERAQFIRFSTPDASVVFRDEHGARGRSWRASNKGERVEICTYGHAIAVAEVDENGSLVVRSATYHGLLKAAYCAVFSVPGFYLDLAGSVSKEQPDERDVDKARTALLKRHPGLEGFTAMLGQSRVLTSDDAPGYANKIARMFAKWVDQIDLAGRKVTFLDASSAPLPREGL